MACIRTGFHAYLEATNCWAYGDAFELNSVHWFRICEVSRIPIQQVKHFTIYDWTVWHDENKTSQSQNSTMICGPFCVTNHGYEGIPI